MCAGLREALLACAVVLGLASSLGGQEVTLELEAAPGEVGQARAAGMLLLQTSGSEVKLLDAQTATLRRYAENGKERGTAISLRGEGGNRPTGSLSFATSGDRILLRSPTQLTLTDDDGGFLAQELLFFAGDVVAKKGSSWLVSLASGPRGGLFASLDHFGRPTPRLVEFHGKLKTGRIGLPVDESETITKSQAVGRSLHLAWAKDRLYAAELARYRVYELGADLELRATYRDPELEREESEAEQEGALASLESRGREVMDRQSYDATRGDRPAATPKAVAFSYKPVIRDIAWIPSLGKLVILLQRGLVASLPVLDLLDPATGQIERFILSFPSGKAGKQPLTQIAVGKHYLWLRAHPGGQPTWRIERSALQEGQRLTLPEVEILAEAQGGGHEAVAEGN